MITSCRLHAFVADWPLPKKPITVRQFTDIIVQGLPENSRDTKRGTHNDDVELTKGPAHHRPSTPWTDSHASFS